MTNSYAQLQTRKSIAAKWIEWCSDSAFFLSRQSFQLSNKKTGELYGLNNKNEFGTETSLGVKVQGGYILTDKAIQPWKYNGKFKSYEDEYNPVLCNSEYSEFAGDTKFDSLDIPQSETCTLLPYSLYLVTSNRFSDRGFAIDSTGGEKDGWVIWACLGGNDGLGKSAKLELVCYSMPLNSDEKEGISIDTPDVARVLGGIYVNPVRTNIGTLQFSICGVMIEKDGKWNIQFPFKNNICLKDSNGEGKQPEEASDKESLTPVDDMYQPSSSKDKKSKKSKNKKHKKK